MRIAELRKWWDLIREGKIFIKDKNQGCIRSGQVYFFNSRIKYAAKLHNTKLYSEIYTVTHNKFIQ